MAGVKSIVATEYGNTDSLELCETETSEPAPGEVRIDIGAAGISFVGIVQRRGTYRGGPEPPYTPGMEAAETIDTVSEGVDREAGGRVVAMTGGGTYARSITTPAPTLFDVPESTSSTEAAGFPVQLSTTYNCLHERDDLSGGERVLIQAAAGGVDTVVIQPTSYAGVEALGTASTEMKPNLATGLGLDRGIQYTKEDFREVIADETDGMGVDLALDGVGDETFRYSLDALADFGRLVTYEAVSDDATEADPMRLPFENKSVIGFHLGNAMQRHLESILGAMPELSELLATGGLDVVVNKTSVLEDAATAHEYIETKKSSGKVVPKP